MTRLKTAVMTAVAAAMFAGPAAAQTVPTLAATVGAPNGVGAVVTLQWTPVPGAEGYTFQAGLDPTTPLVHYNVPGGSSTQGTVFAPNGTYYIRVRAYAGALVGEFSAVQTVVVGGPVTCAPMVAPAVSASNSSYLSVKTDWTPVPGAIGYMVEYSRVNGLTEIAEPFNASVNSVSKYAGFTGNFFVRVVAHNACGEQAASAYMPFEITNSPGTSPRVPDPPPGQLLPVPTYGPAIVEDMARRYPGPLSRACKNNHEFLFLLVQELRKYDSRWGLNWKRGDQGQGMSSDIVAYNATDQPDEGNPRVYIFDVIRAECELNAPGWGDATAQTIPGCNRYPNEWCTKWTLQPYLAAGLPPDPREQ